MKIDSSLVSYDCICAIIRYFNSQHINTLEYERMMCQGFGYQIAISIDGKTEEVKWMLDKDDLNQLLKSAQSGNKPYVVGYLSTNGTNIGYEKYEIGASEIKIETQDERGSIPIKDVLKDWQKAIWIEFYTSFNDDNGHHAENAFANNCLYDASLEELYHENVKWFAEIMWRGFSSDQICKIMPSAERYREEGEALFYKNQGNIQKESNNDVELPSL